MKKRLATFYILLASEIFVLKLKKKPLGVLSFCAFSLKEVLKMVGASEKCTFGIRMPINIHMLNAIIEREVKHFRNYTTYRPNFGALPVSGKFHAAHDMQLETEAQKLKIDDYCNKVTQARAEGPHSKYSAPVTSNHEYGWYHKPLINIDRNDRRFYQPLAESEHTKIEIIILMSNPKSKLKT